MNEVTPKIQSLQFKIIHKIIPCRDNLFKRKIDDTLECLFCFVELLIIWFTFYYMGDNLYSPIGI